MKTSISPARTLLASLVPPLISLKWDSTFRYKCCSAAPALPAALGILAALISVVSGAEELEKKIVRSTLAQVETLSKNAATLEELGKATLSQSSTILDLEKSAGPELLQILKNRKKNWKLRYWATDMLGYVGDKRALNLILGLVKNEKENPQIRIRAVDSLLEMERRKQVEKTELKKELRKLLKNIRKKQIRTKISQALSKSKVKKLSPRKGRGKGKGRGKAKPTSPR